MWEIRNLSKCYGQVQAVKQVSFELKMGETAAVLGESGCGKSTLLRLIAGLQKPDEGSVTRDGQPLSAKLYKREIAMVFQEPALWNHMSVKENLLFGCPEKNKARRNDLVREVAGELGIGELLGRKPDEISGGQARRAAVARALLSQRSLLLLDEPFTNLDPEIKSRTIRTVQKYCGSCAILLVTHDSSEAGEFGARIFRMKAGELESVPGD